MKLTSPNNMRRARSRPWFKSVIVLLLVAAAFLALVFHPTISGADGGETPEAAVHAYMANLEIPVEIEDYQILDQRELLTVEDVIVAATRYLQSAAEISGTELTESYLELGKESAIQEIPPGSFVFNLHYQVVPGEHLQGGSQQSMEVVLMVKRLADGTFEALPDSFSRRFPLNFESVPNDSETISQPEPLAGAVGAIPSEGKITILPGFTVTFDWPCLFSTIHNE